MKYLGGITDNKDLVTKEYVDDAVATATGSSPATVAPLMDGTAAVGTALKYAREDHVHPSDTSRASNATAFQYVEWTESDCDSVTSTRWSSISAAQVSDGIAHFPPTTHGGIFMHFGSGNFMQQFYYPRETADNFIYWRQHVTAGWGAWKLVGEMNYTPTFTSPTMATARATLTSGGYYKVGKLVYVQMAMTIASARGANTMWSYASGFPTPAGTRVALSAYVNSKGTPYTACIDNGSLNLINGNTGTAIDDIVYITGQYIEASS